MTIFFVLIGSGVLFLLYVLANFWRERHRPNKYMWEPDTETLRRDGAEVIVITHPISLSAQGGVSVIPFPLRGDRPGNWPVPPTGVKGAIEMPVKRFSKR
jgi:hypothetical protein